VNTYRDLGDLSAVDPPYARTMYCDACMVKWLGCWDSFMCPECGEGELPSCQPRTRRRLREEADR
jgi:hypothetical protein